MQKVTVTEAQLEDTVAAAEAAAQATPRMQATTRFGVSPMCPFDFACKLVYTANVTAWCGKQTVFWGLLHRLLNVAVC